MADTIHDARIIVAEQQREREGCEVGSCVAPLTVGACVSPLTVGVSRLDAYRTNSAGVTTNPLRTEADWQHAERVIALLADELAEATECDRIGGEPTIVRPCPATDYCVFHHPDSLPCEDATCPAVIAAWTKEATE